MTLTRLREIAAFHIEQRNLANDARRLCRADHGTYRAERFRALAFTHQNAADDLNKFADSLEAAAALVRGLSS
jgi:hypothetical protein